MVIEVYSRFKEIGKFVREVVKYVYDYFNVFMCYVGCCMLDDFVENKLLNVY